MIQLVIWDLGDTLVTPPADGRDLRPLDQYQNIVLRPGAAVALERVRRAGLTQAVLSNTTVSGDEDARRLLARLGVRQYFRKVVATASESDPSRPGKPAPEVFEQVLDALGVRAEAAVMVGNTWDTDILGANGAGLHALWLQAPAVCVRADWQRPVHIPPWILPVGDVAGVPAALDWLRDHLPPAPAGS